MSEKTTRRKPIGFDSIHRHFHAGHATVAQTGWRCRACRAEIWLPKDWQDHVCGDAAEQVSSGSGEQEGPSAGK
jgi:hypothetical protein